MLLLSQVTAGPPLREKSPSGSHDCMPSLHLGRPTKSDLQVPLQHVPLNTSDNKQHTTRDVEPSQQPRSSKKLRTTSQKTESICMGHFHNRHVFQQQLIEKQKKKLQEQQKTILELKQSQRLAEARWAAERAAAVTDAQSCLLSNPRGKEPKRTCHVLPKYVHYIRTCFGLMIWVFSPCGREAPEPLLPSFQTPWSLPFFYCILSKQRSPPTLWLVRDRY